MVDPQDKPKIPVKSPNSMLLQKIIRSPLQECLKFLSAHDLIHFYSASRYCQYVAKDDFMWRFLTQQLLFYEKHEMESWKQSYLRCARIEKNQDMDRTNKKFSFEMCPIRHFRAAVVKLLHCHSNFVFAVDAQGKFATFWIDENDQENDEETLQVKEFELGEEPIAMYVYPAERAVVRSRQQQQSSNEVVIVTQRNVHTFMFARENLELKLEIVRKVELPFQNPSNVYSCEIADKVIFISNLPQSYSDFSQDPQVNIYNAGANVSDNDNQEEIVAKTLQTHVVEIAPDETDEQHPQWADNPNNPGAQKKKSMRQNHKLAVMNPQTGTVYALMFNNKLLEINPKPSAAFLLRNYGKHSRVLKMVESLTGPQNVQVIQPVILHNNFRPRRPRRGPLQVDYRFMRGIDNNQQPMEGLAAAVPNLVEEEKKEVVAQALEEQANLGKLIAIDYHKGHLMVIGSQALGCFYVHNNEWSEQVLDSHTSIKRADFVLPYELSLDHNYVQVIKQQSKVLIIGNVAPQAHDFYRNVNRQVQQRIIWIDNIQLGALAENPGDMWNISKIETGFQPDANKQVNNVSQLAVSPTVKLLGNALGSCVQIFNLNNVAQGAHYLTVASRSVKTNIPDPDYPEGVSKIVITPSKVVVALGNVIRAYSFDLKA